MSAPFVPTLSLWQKLDLIPALLQCISGTFLTATLAPFRGGNTAPTFKRHSLLSLMDGSLAVFQRRNNNFLQAPRRYSIMLGWRQKSCPRTKSL